MNPTNHETIGERIREIVRDGYGRIAEGETACCGGGGCCGVPGTDVAERLAQQIGYSPEDLASLPEGANLGLSCGNPSALAALAPGEVVLDLGCGGGFDVFIAARKVEAGGRVI